MPQETLKSFAVIDTNVIVAAARKTKNSSSYDREIMQLVMDSNITLLVDKRVLEEYLDVLSRPTHRLSGEDIGIMMESIINRSVYVQDVEKAKIEIWDQDDIPFFEITESALELDSRLVTHITKDFVEKKYDEAGHVIERKPGDKPASDRIVTPEEYITSLGNLQRYLDTLNFSVSGVNERFDEKMQNMLESGKYVLTRDVVFYDSNSQSNFRLSAIHLSKELHT